jgi:hypothetical protein
LKLPCLYLSWEGKCGSKAAGWLNGQHPTSIGQSQDAEFCFHYGTNTCTKSAIGKVTNCGNFFVYNLPDTPDCSLRYCTDSTTSPGKTKIIIFLILIISYSMNQLGIFCNILD